ncbi:hypothetical protein XaplCFBP3123_02590 [Xanthomonas arboricola pv. populi]|nr:hypothetical protein XaplCFBP3123_02590 [Xanthomonas arboricola pv. populi]
MLRDRTRRIRTAFTCTPTISTGPCPPAVAGPYAARMPRKSLHGRIHGVSRDGGRARTLQQSRRSDAAPFYQLSRRMQSTTLATPVRRQA